MKFDMNRLFGWVGSLWAWVISGKCYGKAHNKKVHISIFYLCTVTFFPKIHWSIKQLFMI